MKSTDHSVRARPTGASRPATRRSGAVTLSLRMPVAIRNAPVPARNNTPLSPPFTRRNEVWLALQ